MRATGVLGLLLVAGLAATVQRRVRHAASDHPHFERVTDDVYSLRQWWYLVPGLPPVLPVAMALVRVGDGSWVLVDAGTKDNSRQPHASRLLSALRAAIPAGERLVAIALTHGHHDHIGALPHLLEAYPDVPVLAHELEAPYLLQGELYMPCNSFFQRAYEWAGTFYPAGEPKLPADRFHLLRGQQGDLSQWGAPGVAWSLAPGHTPGHVVFTTPGLSTNVALAGDAASLLWPSLRLGAAATERDSSVIAAVEPPAPLPPVVLAVQPMFLCYPPSCTRQDALRTACALLGRSLPFDLLLAGHDFGIHPRSVWTQKQVLDWAKGAPECRQFD